MNKLWKCLLHDSATEIYCRACKSYICPVCVTDHGNKGHVPDYIHITHYAPEVAFPIIDGLLKDVSGKDSDMNLEATEFVESLTAVIPTLKEPIAAHVKQAMALKQIASQLNMYISPLKAGSVVDKIKLGLEVDIKRLQEAIKKKELQAVINIVRRMECDEKVVAGPEKDKALVGAIKTQLEGLGDLKSYTDILEGLQLLAFKCQHLRINCCVTDWKCDKKYFSSKMTLSEDGLVYGNNAGSGYPAIIGDTPFEIGVSAFEVIPEGLCCGGNEGFGIIELERYKTIFAADNSTPTCYTDMIGAFHSNSNHNMTVVNGNAVNMGQKYVVKVDLINYTMTIKGPGCHLKAELKQDTLYVPCFSCGCRANKFTIKPLDTFDDD